MGWVDVDLFASSLYHEILRDVSWQTNPQTWIGDIFQINWTNLKAYAFVPFPRDDCALTIVATVWPSQKWYSMSLRMRVQNPILILPFLNIVRDPKQKCVKIWCHNCTSILMVWEVYNISILQKVCWTK